MKLFGIILITSCITLYACNEKGTHYLTFVNNSERRIALQEHFLDAITSEDTLYQCRKGADGVGPDTFFHVSAGRHSTWEGNMKGSYLQFLVMDCEVYANYIGTPCDTIRKHVPILHRYCLTLEDLQRLKWIITYPPTETMNNVKSYQQ